MEGDNVYSVGTNSSYRHPFTILSRDTKVPDKEELKKDPNGIQ